MQLPLWHGHMLPLVENRRSPRMVARQRLQKWQPDKVPLCSCWPPPTCISFTQSQSLTVISISSLPPTLVLVLVFLSLKVKLSPLIVQHKALITHPKVLQLTLVVDGTEQACIKNHACDHICAAAIGSARNRKYEAFNPFHVSSCFSNLRSLCRGLKHDSF